jgi:hypothetical protein
MPLLPVQSSEFLPLELVFPEADPSRTRSSQSTLVMLSVKPTYVRTNFLPRSLWISIHLWVIHEAVPTGVPRS